MYIAGKRLATAKLPAWRSAVLPPVAKALYTAITNTHSPGNAVSAAISAARASKTQLMTCTNPPNDVKPHDNIATKYSSFIDPVPILQYINLLPIVSSAKYSGKQTLVQYDNTQIFDHPFNIQDPMLLDTRFLE